jgi:hypothetical protein
MRFCRTASLLLLAALAMAPAIVAHSTSTLDSSVPPMRALIERFTADQATLVSVYADPLAPATRERMAVFYRENRAQLATVNFNALDQEGKVDSILFANFLTQQEHKLALDERQWKEVAPLLPFAPAIFALEDARRRMERPDPQKAAAQLSELATAVAASRKELEDRVKNASPAERINAWRAAADLDQLTAQLQHWFDFWNGYDPAFTWWAAQPYKQASVALKDDATFLREKLAGIATDDKTTVIGTPIGREALLQQLDDAMIPYTPEELIDMAKEQLAWCQQEMVTASRERTIRRRPQSCHHPATR